MKNIKNNIDDIQKEVSKMYLGDTEYQSILFDISDTHYLSIKSDVKMLMDKDINFYQNVLIKIEKDSNINFSKKDSYYISDTPKEKLSINFKGTDYSLFNITNQIVEITESTLPIENTILLAKYFIDKDLDKTKVYSMIINNTLTTEYKKIMTKEIKCVSFK